MSTLVYFKPLRNLTALHPVNKWIFPSKDLEHLKAAVVISFSKKIVVLHGHVNVVSAPKRM